MKSNKANNHNKQNKPPPSSYKWIGLKKYEVKYLPKENPIHLITNHEESYSFFSI